MRIILKIILFAIVAAGGAYTSPFLILLAVRFNFMPQLPQESALFHEMSLCLVRGPWAVWALAVVAALGWFVAKTREIRAWLLLAPVYVPAIYTILVLVYFNFVPVT